MGLSLSRKIIARAAGRRSVEPGERVLVTPHKAMTYDPQAGPLQRRLGQRWGDTMRLWDPDRVILVADHFLAADNPAHRKKQEELAAFAHRFGVRHFYPVGAPNHGVCHALLPEEGLVRPGELIAGTDSHSSTYGGFGAIGLNVGADAMEGILAIGEHWMEVPTDLRIVVEGRLPADVTAKDVILKLCADLCGTRAAFGAAIELDGEAIQSLHPEEKLTLANMAQEIGARWLVIPPDATVTAWVAALTSAPFEPLRPDPDANYAQVLSYRGEEFRRMVALPGGPERAVPVEHAAAAEFNEVFVGSCTGAKRHDLEVFLDALQAAGGPAPGISVMLAPATRRTRDWILAEPARAALAAAPGVRLADQSGCDACAGIYGFIADDRAVRLSTANRNYVGRMGAPGAQVFLGSAATAALVATTGRLCA
jgi:homoaconitase/3-isopropylmalate dehydratase large subunit